MIDDFSGELNAFIRRAEKEVFIIGGSMRKFSATEDIINKLIKDKNIKFHILVLNIEKAEIRDGFKELLGNLTVADNLNHFRVFNNNKNVEIRIYETLPTSYFYAVDLHHGLKGTIQVLPILFGKPELDCPQIEIDRNNENLYEFYSNFIENFWEKGSPFK